MIFPRPTSKWHEAVVLDPGIQPVKGVFPHPFGPFARRQVQQVISPEAEKNVGKGILALGPDKGQVMGMLFVPSLGVDSHGQFGLLVVLIHQEYPRPIVSYPRPRVATEMIDLKISSRGSPSRMASMRLR